ncbi:MAG: Sua5/YciO/YrdC/YwlC family protein, partial [Planctomycetes bacterium]|nr:Sua5/YciO/YrdC/YwlC family protein [Planctomycetota bacterium]
MSATLRNLTSEDPAAVTAAADALRAGEIVLLPTETVYGLAVRADDAAAVERLRELKGRDERPFVRLVADAATAEAAAFLPAPAKRLAARYWPGPLTLVLDPRAGGDSIGYRVPGLAFAREVVASAGVPVFATSANLSGQPPTADCAAALAALG